MDSFLATSRLAFKDTVKRPGFWIVGLSFLFASGAASIPFAPGIPAEPDHYLESGVSTLYLGGLFLSVALVPVLLGSGKERRTGEGFLTLPLGRTAFTAGAFFGFATALFWFFAVGGLILLRLSRATEAAPHALSYVAASGWCYFMALVGAALALLASRLLAYAPAVAATCLVLLMSQISGLLPPPFSWLLVALDGMNPLILVNADGPEQCFALVHGTLVILLCLRLASQCLGREPSA